MSQVEHKDNKSIPPSPDQTKREEPKVENLIEHFPQATSKDFSEPLVQERITNLQPTDCILEVAASILQPKKRQPESLTNEPAKKKIKIESIKFEEEPLSQLTCLNKCQEQLIEVFSTTDMPVPAFVALFNEKLSKSTLAKQFVAKLWNGNMDSFINDFLDHIELFELKEGIEKAGANIHYGQMLEIGPMSFDSFVIQKGGDALYDEECKTKCIKMYIDVFYNIFTKKFRDAVKFVDIFSECLLASPSTRSYIDRIWNDEKVFLNAFLRACTAYFIKDKKRNKILNEMEIETNSYNDNMNPAFDIKPDVNNLF